MVGFGPAMLGRHTHMMMVTTAASRMGEQWISRLGHMSRRRRKTEHRNIQARRRSPRTKIWLAGTVAVAPVRPATVSRPPNQRSLTTTTPPSLPPSRAPQPPLSPTPCLLDVCLSRMRSARHRATPPNALCLLPYSASQPRPHPPAAPARAPPQPPAPWLKAPSRQSP